MLLKISARKSDLARLQAYMVGDALKKNSSKLEIEYRFKESLGDINLTDPLWKIPQKGVFTEDFHSELINGETDMVVHSWKDLPTEPKPDTQIVATLTRADQRDLLLVKKSHFDKIRSSRNLNLFSSSPRREHNLKNFVKDHLPFDLATVQFQNVRGNIPTRIRKLLETAEVDGLIVAKAALDRLLSAPQPEFYEVQQTLHRFLSQLEWMVLPLAINPNAAAQGALAIEIANSREDLKRLLAAINDQETFRCAEAERKVLSSYGGGCHQKIGVSILTKPYGEIQIQKGLTQAGVVLDSRNLRTFQEPLKTKYEDMHCCETKTQRIPLKNWTLPENTNALFVARMDAWPLDSVKGHKDIFNFPHIVWTAGITTWKHLAKKGVWVHGCNEGLGESESAKVDILTQRNLGTLHWAKLTHQDTQSSSGDHEDAPVMTVIPTYSLEFTGDFQCCIGKKSYFWKSGSHFLAAVKKNPEIIQQQHSCGPGRTFKIIRQFLTEHNSFDPTRLRIFLDMEDWRQQCTIT